MDKDDKIDQLQAKIRKLEDKLNRTKKRVSYLGKLQQNLKTTLSDMKKQNIIDEDDCKLLEVIHANFFNPSIILFLSFVRNSMILAILQYKKNNN